MYKSIGGLATATERGFGEIRAERHENRKADMGSVKADNNLELETKLERVKSDLKRTKWQVRLLFGVVSSLFHSCMRYRYI